VSRGFVATVTATPAASFGAGGATAGASGASGSHKSSLCVQRFVEPDLWGNIRRGVTASAATPSQWRRRANARLLYQAELAQDYFGLHGNDGEAELLTRTEASYEEYLTLTRNRSLPASRRTSTWPGRRNCTRCSRN